MLVGTIKAFFGDEGGATAIEYALIAMLIGIALIGTMSVLGDGLQGLFNNGASEVLTEQAAKIH